MFHFVVAHLVGQDGQQLLTGQLFKEGIEEDNPLCLPYTSKISIGVGRAFGAVHGINPTSL